MFFKKIYSYLLNKVIKFILDRKLFFIKEKKVKHNNIDLKFKIVNYISYYRAKTFSYKEPETLNWIDNFKENSVFFDIGANVGIYSIYAVKSKNCEVYSFEPSVFNLELLVNNIQLNNVAERTHVIPLAIYNNNSIQRLNLSNQENAGALSTFGKWSGTEVKIDGKEYSIMKESDIMGISKSKK